MFYKDLCAWDNYVTEDDMSKIIPIRDLKNTTEISSMCHESDEPIFITKNGYSDMVIMSDETYTRLTAVHRPVVYEVPLNEACYVSDGAAAATAGTAPYSIPLIKRILTPIMKKYNVRSAVLFGSYAKGEENERSDIDLIVDSGLRGLAFFGLLEEVSSAFRVPVDLIEKYQIKAGSGMENEIRETGIRIYG